METDRRNFLKQFSGVTAAMVAAPALVQESAATPQDAAAGGNVLVGGALPAVQRTYTAGKFALELDGLFAGWVFSTEGGNATGDVVVEKVGEDHIERKHIGGVKYEDITVTCGTGMSKVRFPLLSPTAMKRPRAMIWNRGLTARYTSSPSFRYGPATSSVTSFT